MSPDMTIESALSDPLIRAVMRADRIEPQAFERLLRSAARTIDRAPRPILPVLAARPPRAAFWDHCCA